MFGNWISRKNSKRKVKEETVLELNKNKLILNNKMNMSKMDRRLQGKS
jgi:hypothetical protein